MASGYDMPLHTPGQRWATASREGGLDRSSDNSAPSRDLSVDKILVVVVVALLLFGLVMVYSASAIISQKQHGTQFYFLLRQGIWGLIGLGLMTAALKIDYRHY